MILLFAGGLVAGACGGFFVLGMVPPPGTQTARTGGTARKKTAERRKTSGRK